MIDIQIWFIYFAITAVLALIVFIIPETSKGLLKTIKAIAGFCLVLVGITFIAVTIILILHYVAPNFDSSNNSNDQEQCIPDPWGGC